MKWNDGNIIDKVYVGFDFLYRLIYLNLLWILFTAIGFILFGFGPSTIALYSITRKWLQKDLGKDKDEFLYFWKEYKAHFKTGNSVGLGVAILFYMLLVNYRYTNFRAEMIYILINSATLLILLFFSLFLAYLLSLYVHYELEWKDYFVKALTLSYLQPLPSLLLIFWGGLVIYLTVVLFPYSLLICMSGMTYGLMGICYSSFNRNEMMLEDEKKQTEN